MSRRIEQPILVNVRINLRQQLVELAGRQILPDLPIPIVLLPIVEASCQFGPFLQSKVPNAGLDLFKSHT